MIKVTDTVASAAYRSSHTANRIYVEKLTSGTVIDVTGLSIVAGDVIRLTGEASGGNLLVKVWLNGAQVGTTLTDTTPLTGSYIGLSNRYGDGTGRSDDFSGGDIEAIAPTITGPTGAAGAASSTSSGAENSVTGPTFTTDIALGGGYPTITGADASLFTIVPLTATSWRVDFLVAPNFEAPGDVGANNVYDFTFNASATVSQTHARTVTNVNEAPTFTGTISIPALTVGTAMSSYATAGFFGDPDSGDTAAYSAIGTWPAGVTVNASTGAISGTPTVAGTYASLQVRRTDSGALTVNSNSFTITVDPAPLVITTDVLRDETNAILASTTINKLVATRLSDLVQVATWADQVTSAGGVLSLTHASLTAVPHIITTSNTAGTDAGAKVYTPA